MATDNLGRRHSGSAPPCTTTRSTKARTWVRVVANKRLAPALLSTSSRRYPTQANIYSSGYDHLHYLNILVIGYNMPFVTVPQVIKNTCCARPPGTAPQNCQSSTANCAAEKSTEKI
jgi:hypothetical protein